MSVEGAAPEPRTLLLALDAVPFRVVVEARRRGAFSGWAEPSAVVAPFPTVTHVAFASLFEPFGVAPSLGYELRHFDTATNSTVGGGVFDYASAVPPWFEVFDLPHRSMVAELANYVSPRAAAHHAVGEIEREVLASDRELFSAYVGATDGLMHLYGDEPMIELLVELDGMLAAVGRRHREATGRGLRMVLFSDHGCGCTKVRHADGFDGLLRDAGLNVVGQLDGPKDVVAPKFGLVNFGALFLSDEDQAGPAADAVARHDAVELAVYSPGPGAVEVVGPQGRGRVRWVDDGDTVRYAYEHDGADPLRLAPALERLDAVGALDDAGFAADADWLRETVPEYYPDPLHRLRQALTGDRVRSRASVLYSLAPSWAGGWHTAVVGAWVRHGRLEGTHGGLDRESSLGFLLVDDPAFAMPPAVRANAALAAFAELVAGSPRPSRG
jgi:hypothetical protein